MHTLFHIVAVFLAVLAAIELWVTIRELRIGNDNAKIDFAVLVTFSIAAFVLWHL